MTINRIKDDYKGNSVIIFELQLSECGGIQRDFDNEGRNLKKNRYRVVKFEGEVNNMGVDGDGLLDLI